jgi:hypothetical protein
VREQAPLEQNRHTLRVCGPEGFDVSTPDDHSSHRHVPGPDESSVPELEDDENVAPRPEEEIADVLRAKPDLGDHSRH